MISPSPQLPIQLRMAAAFLQQGQLNQAQSLLESYLKVQPRHLETLNALALVTMQTEQYEKAVEYLTKAISVKPKVAGLHSNLGNAYQQLGMLQEALGAYRKAIQLDPRFAQAFYNRGHVFQSLGDLENALDSFDKAVVIQPEYADAYNSRGIVLQLLNRTQEAMAGYQEAIRLSPGHAKAHANLGDLFSSLKQYDNALAHYDLALLHQPKYIKALSNKGVLLQQLNQFELALECFDQILQSNPQSWEALSNRAVTLQKMRLLEDAAKTLMDAIGINPNQANLYNNLGNILGELGRFNEALDQFDRAIAISPIDTSALINRGIALQEMGDLSKSIDFFDRALKLEPENPEAHWSKSVSLLLSGEFDLGWHEFEWRWQRQHVLNQQTHSDKPLWLGDASLEGRTILLHGEQGLGDVLQFCRYASAITKRSARVILEVPPPLLELCRTLDDVHQVIALGTATELEIDYQCPLMSLPHAFKTSFTNPPPNTPYLKIDPTKAAFWKAKLGEKKHVRIGLVWSGGFRAELPELWGVNSRRNIPLELLATLNTTNVQFVSLQKGELAQRELTQLQKNPCNSFFITDFTEEFNDFSDTAAVIDNLDLIISVDTSTAHLAAALGKPVWMLNRFDSCWRWQRTGKETFWYPTMKIYRQHSWQDWSLALKELKSDLTHFVNERSLLL
jgi:tetratricopeptide (TPR) repeat protein